MKSKIYKVLLSFCCFLFVVQLSFSQSQTSNSISGFVFDAKSRTPIPDVYVELLDEVYATLRRVKTDGAGRFFFSGISAGNFKVKVLPYRTNYTEEIQDVAIINYSFGNVRTSDSVYLDFYLHLDKRKINIDEFGLSGTIFVQDISSEARKLYKKGISQLDDDKEAENGLETLKKALDISPNYYDALNRIGIEYVRRKKYLEALPHLIKSIEINQKSFSSFYAIGIVAYNLREFTEAADAFKASVIINPSSVFAQLQYGRVLRINGNIKEAEATLLKAKILAKDSIVPEIHWQLGLLYNKIGLYSKAADELENYLKIQKKLTNEQEIKKLISLLRKKAKLTPVLDKN